MLYDLFVVDYKLEHSDHFIKTKSQGLSILRMEDNISNSRNCHYSNTAAVS